MGWVDRLGRAAAGVGQVLSGAGRVVHAPVGFVADLATAPFNDDDEFDGVLNTIRQRLRARFVADPGAAFGRMGGGVDEAMFGADEVLAAPLGKAAQASAWLYGNVVSQPLTTVVIQSMKPGGLLSPGEWGSAYHEAEHVSPGQALLVSVAAPAAAILPGRQGVEKYDLSTAEGIHRAVADIPAGSLISGSLDFTANVFLDPAVAIGKAGKAVKVAKVTKPVQQATITPTLANNRTDRFLEVLFTHQTPGERADWLAHNPTIADTRNPATPALVHLLAHAEDAEDARMVLRAAMTADPLAKRALAVRSAEAAATVDYLRDTRIPLVQAMLDGETNTFQQAWGRKTVADLQAAAAASKTVAARQQMLADVAGTMQRQPRVTAGQRVSDHVHWDLWQPSVYNVPMRVIKAASTIRPGVVDFHDRASWINLQRFLDQSGMDSQTKGNLLLRWAQVTDSGVNEAGQRAVLHTAEAAAMRALAARHGLSEQLADEAFKHGTVRRSETLARLSDPRYSAVTADGRHLDLVDDDGHLLRLPILVSQLENYHPLLDLTDAARVLSRYASELRGREDDLAAVLHAIRSNRRVTGAAAGLEDIGQALNNVWKPAQLLRLGYTVRNVTDESLRTIATFGVMSYLPMVGRALRARHAENVGVRQRKALERITAKMAEGAASPVEVELASRLRGQLADEDTAHLFAGTVRIGGYQVEDLYGGDGASARRAAVSSRDNIRQLTTDQGTILNRLRTQASEWVDVGPTETGYEDAWLRAVNDQIREDPIARLVLEGATDDQVVRFLRSRDGKALRQRIGVRGGDPHRWAAEVRAHTEAYVPTQELRALATQRPLTFADLERAVPQALTRPTVHGESLAVALRKSKVTAAVRNTVDRVMDRLGAAPNDVLVRHPFAELAYRTRLRDLVEKWEPPAGRLDEATLRELQDQARTYALRQVKETLYELTEQPNLARAIRFVVPFYGAWNDSVTRWARLFAEDPSRIGRGLQLWNLPNKAGIIQNDDGDDMLVLALPDAVRDHIPGAKALGELRISKRSLLPMLQGQNPMIPGAGYMVAIPVAEVARRRPDLADEVSLLLPFGPGRDALDQFLPAAAKRLRSSAEEDRSYASWQLRITQDLLYERNIGRNQMTDQQILAEAERRTRQFFALRTVINLTFPAVPEYQSPHQFLIDKAREYRDAFDKGLGPPDLDSWEGWFVRDYGDDAWPYTLAMSKATAAIAPTEEGFHAYQANKDLIGAHPQLAGLIVGDDAGNGRFSRAVYEWQFRQPVGPGDTRKLRTSQDPAEALKELGRSQGWEKWITASRWIDAQLQQRGLATLNDRGAADLLQLKQAVRIALQEQFPDWYDDYTTFNRDPSSTVHDIGEIAADQRFDGQPGWASLREYLQARTALVDLLQARWQAGGSLNLQANSNADLRWIWESFISELKGTDASFASMQARWLDSDTLTTGV